jgi:hypothetical protein
MEETKELKANSLGPLSGLPLVKIGQSLLIIGIALGVALLVYSSPLYTYEFGLSTLGASSNVKFIHWADETFSNTISLNYNMYADVTTYDANATYGITNLANKLISISVRIESISNSGKVANLTLTIFSQDGTQQMTRISWAGGNSVPTSPQTFNANPQTSYVIQVSLKGADSVTAGDTSSIILQLSSPE